MCLYDQTCVGPGTANVAEYRPRDEVRNDNRADSPSVYPNLMPPKATVLGGVTRLD
jgi:hypothetical protein